jgi:thioredoxin 1
VVEQIAEDFGDDIVVAKIDVDDNGEVAQRFGIRGIPSLLVFKNGKVVDEVRPGNAAARLKKYID